MNFLEMFKMAIMAIWANRLRSFLTLIGVIAGVASIIAVMTGISVVQKTMEQEMSVLGNQTFQAQKWAAGGPLTDEERRKIAQRRPLTVEHANIIREKVKTVDLVGAELWDFGHRVKYKDKSTDPYATICGGTPEYAPNNTHLIQYGRNLTNEDVKIARSVVVIGYALANEIFPFIDPLQKVIKIDGRKYTIVGVFEEKKSAMGGNYDNYILMPISRFKRVYGSTNGRGRARSVNITVRARRPELIHEAIEETRAVLRAARNVDPREDDDFTIYSNNSQIKAFNEATAGVKAGAFIIGIIALVVAGIGIMNIMLVSVTERTREIGIRKSLGARRKTILTQFLLEAVVLCNIGGVIGVLIGFGLGNLTSIFTGFAAHVPLEWAFGGLAFCTAVGLTFGLWPAIQASRLNPIEALRFE